ncbi:hypothetical protein EMCRGX_G025345 [Ephydatia muelleri]
MENDVSDCDECDDLVEEAYAYLLSKKYPEYASESRKRVIRRKATKLTLSGEGELLYKLKQGKGKVYGKLRKCFYVTFRARRTSEDPAGMSHDSEDLFKAYKDLEDRPYAAAFDEHAHILEEAKGNIIAAQLRQKKAYDRKHCKPGHYQCDQLVLLKNFKRQKVKGGKLMERYLGPYTIMNVLPHGVYELCNEKGKTTRATGSHLKMYKSSDAQCIGENEGSITGDVEPEADLDGRESEADLDGRESEADLDGRESEADLDGRESEADLDGRESEADLDGRESEADLDGRESEADLDGRELEADLDGRELDGRELEANLDGKKMECDLNSKKMEGGLNDKKMECGLNSKKLEGELSSKKSKGDLNSRELEGDLDGKKLEGEKKGDISQRRKRRRSFTSQMKKEILDGDWLSDQHMFYAQELLRMQFPMFDGWQSTLLAQANAFIPVRMDAIQIHMTNSHWVTSLRHRETVTLFDCQKVAGELSSTLANQLCQVYRTSIRERRGNSFLAVNVAAVQMQRGMDDCALFVIAFALHAALGHCIEEIDFDQTTMRNHLVKCFTARKFTPSTTKKVKRACSTRIINIDVFCTCQMPASYGGPGAVWCV